MTFRMIAVDSLRKEYSVGTGTEVAVDGISFEVSEGEFFTLVGPSGCGKTTTLRCIAGLETPTDGHILFNGSDITDVPPHKRNLAMMFQRIALYPHMTIRENIGYPLKVRRVPEEEASGQIEEAAEMMQIADMLDKHPGELSGGQQQRAALARTVVQDPDGFLMDEPLSDLDAKLKRETRKEIQRIHRELEKPTIYVTHDQEEAMTMSDRIAVLNDGKIAQIGSPRELYTEPNNLFVARFIGSPPMNIIDGHLVQTGDQTATVRANGRDFEFAPEYLGQTSEEQEVKIGFRPDTVSYEEHRGSLQINAKVQLIETVGGENSVTLEWEGKELEAILPSDAPVSEGETVDVYIGLENLVVFDSASGELVIKSKPKGIPAS